MQISRRDFLRYVGASAVALGLSSSQLLKIERRLASAAGPPVIWLNGASCSGCSVSFMNAVNPTVDQVLVNTVSLKYHSTLMAAAGDLAVTSAVSTAGAGGHVLVVEGAIPAGDQGRYCYVWDEAGQAVTMIDALRAMADKAAYVLAVGTCAAFGGIPAAFCGTDVQSLGVFLGRGVINLPGCPPHPDWIIGTVASILSGVVPTLDRYSRPTSYYTQQVIHTRCPRRHAEEADHFGQSGYCLEELGCRGPITHADCDLRLWNNGQNWCIGANGLCIGCTEPNFPAFPLHGELDDDEGRYDPVECVSGPLPPSPPPANFDKRIHLPIVTRGLP
jgi:hydrogenase small subunit